MDSAKLKLCCQKINQFKDLSQPVEFTSCYKIIAGSFIYGQSNGKLNEICKILLDHDFVSSTSQILENLKQQGFYKFLELTQIIFGCLICCSNCNEEICKAIISSQIKEILISECYDPIHLQNLNNIYCNDIIYNIIGIIHNIVRHPGNEEYFKLDDLKIKLLHFVKCDFQVIRISALLALSYLVDDRDKEVLKSGKDLIKLFVYIIKEAQKSIKKERCYNVFSIWEMLSGLKMISVNDDMKNVIVKEGGIELAVDILRIPKSDEEVEFSLGLLINLCFDKNIFENFSKEYDINKIVKPYKNHDNQKIKQLHDTFMWMEENQRNEDKYDSYEDKWDSYEPKLKFDVFISYSHENKEQVKMIQTKLNESKLKIWVDLNEMHGSVIDAMAHGIESSKVFLMCLSSTYRTSTYCRPEADHAFNLKKPIIPIIFDKKCYNYGWVGFIIGSKKYIKFNSETDFLISYNELKKELNHHLTTQDSTIESEMASSRITPLNCDFTDSPNMRTLKDWTKDDVVKWLEESNLSHIRDKFYEYDGHMLISLKDIKNNDSKDFHNHLKEIKLTSNDRIKFNAAFQKLMDKN